MINKEPNVIIKSRTKSQKRNILDTDIPKKPKNRKEDFNDGYIQTIKRSISESKSKKSKQNDKLNELERDS